MPTMTPRKMSEQLFAEISMTAALGPTRHSIREFRTILEAIFRHLTLRERRSFLNLFGRMEFVFESQRTDPSIRAQAHALRRYANHHSHSRIDPSREDWQLSLKAICETVTHFFDAPVPDALLSLYQNLGEEKLQVLPPPKGEDGISIRIHVSEFSNLEVRDDISYFTVHGVEEDLGEISLRLWNGLPGSMSHLHHLLRPHNTLLVTECRKAEEGQANYTTTKDSLAVLEPDLLMDVSELANCFEDRDGKPEIFLAGNLVPQASSYHAYLGTLVNSVLDENVRNPDANAKTAIEIALRDNFLNALPH
ncbi:MAG: hypothetical protein EBZ67_11615, partial [Chitinophagia bacterium]|nr:hypothetical protein [Chitinophagia bacterium]